MTTPFLVSSWTGLPEAPLLDGFAWDGADLIVGSDGLAAFAAARGRMPGPAVDGAHIRLVPEGNGAVIGADSAGYRHLFHWSDGAHWAVSESFVDLVEHLRGQGVALAANRAQLGAFLSRKQLFQQLTTRDTAVAGIRVLLPGERLEAGGAGLRVLPPPAVPRGDYPVALRVFLETWLGRVLTLVAGPDLRAIFHLSGGVDSRAAAALLVWLSRHRDLPAGRTGLHSLTDAAHAEDLAVAEAVAEATGLRLNTLGHRPMRTLSAEESLRLWQTQCAGAYSPLRLSRAVFDPRDVHFTGHGGGGYKADLSAAEVDRAIEGMERAYGYFGRGDRAGWRRAIEALLAGLSPDRGSAWTRLQRVSRARFHGGQAASYKTQAAIFDSALAAAAGDARGPGQGRGTQFHYDIIATLAPDLLDVPFDTARKAPTAAQRAALTRVEGLAPEAGTLFGAFATRPQTPLGAEGDPYAAFMDQLGPAWRTLPRGEVSALFRFHLWRGARRLRRGRRPDPVALRHMHTAWLIERLRTLGVSLDGQGGGSP